MDKLIEGFSGQLKRSIEIAEAAKITKHHLPVHNILVTGLGGSGIGGTIVSQIVDDHLKIPMLVNKNYSIPGFVNEHTIVIVSSYSGNTEETYAAMMAAFKREAKIICITSGGKIMDFAKCNGLDYIEIDGGMPPRSCFGYSFVQQLYILYYLGLINDGFKKELKRAIELMDKQQKDIQAEARALAEKLESKIPVIYSDANYEGLAIRFRQQINENSKLLCWHHVIPEMNHNELVGWRKDYSEMAVVFLRNKDDFSRNQQRMDFTRTVAISHGAEVFEVWSKGDSKLEKTLYLLHLTDWVSFFIADIRKMDAVEVNVITNLKNELAKTPMN